MEEIFKRRSIRKYQTKQVEAAKIKRLIEAAVAAPSAGNEQPWHFIIIKERERLNKLAEIHPYAKMLKEAPLAIAVCGDPAQERYKGFWVQDCAAATQNILLEAVALNLGAVWLSGYPGQPRERDVSDFLELPEGIKTLSVIALGYPAEEKSKSNRYREEIIHLEKW